MNISHTPTDVSHIYVLWYFCSCYTVRTHLALTNLPARLLAILPCKLTFSGGGCFSMLIGQREKERHPDSAFLYFCRCNLCFISHTFWCMSFFMHVYPGKVLFFSGRTWRVTHWVLAGFFMHVVKYSHGILLSRSICWLKLE